MASDKHNLPEAGWRSMTKVTGNPDESGSVKQKEHERAPITWKIQRYDRRRSGNGKHIFFEAYFESSLNLDSEEGSYIQKAANELTKDGNIGRLHAETFNNSVYYSCNADLDGDKTETPEWFVKNAIKMLELLNSWEMQNAIREYVAMLKKTEGLKNMVTVKAGEIGAY